MFAGQSILVAGLAESGTAVARLLLHGGARVTVIDRGRGAGLNTVAASLRQAGARVYLETEQPPAGDFDLAVVSPGVPSDAAVIRCLLARGIPLLTELEVGWRVMGGRVLAISGSNGKSTLAKLCAEALTLAGYHAVLGGNYGPPVSSLALDTQQGMKTAPDWLVLEVSSFQLEWVSKFRPRVGVVLNITPNHLDRHGDMSTYRRLKARLFAAQTDRDVAIAGITELAAMRALSGSRARWQSFASLAEADFFYQDGQILNRLKLPPLSIAGTHFDNSVLGLTAAAAAAALAACGVDGSHLELAARRYQPLPHRLREVALVRGIRWVDDSKATNLAAMLAALQLTAAPVRLIAGGRPKGEDFRPARPLLAQKAAAVYLIGEAASAMADAWRETVPCTVCDTLDQAVRAAADEAQTGDTVLLSPACASFDQYAGYAERGAAFIRAARRVAGHF